MPAFSFGASGLKMPSLNFGTVGPKLSVSQPFRGFQIIVPRYIQWESLKMSARPNRVFVGCRCSASDENSCDSSEDTVLPSQGSKLIPKPFEVEALVTEICDTTSIAEFELKLGGFRLYVLRDLNPQETHVPPPVTAPVSVNTAIDVPNANGSVPSAPLSISRLGSSRSAIETLLVKAVDEGLVILQSPKVGYFRRSRTIKGKRAPPSCKEKQQVKDGQVLCYIEQLGGEIPVESEVSGEVIKILREDGDPVGYGDALIAILPSFPGIKKL